jgi:mannose-1-phosphate guanylyltransferase
MNCLSRIDVVILAGGKGSRLASLFPDQPKCLVPVLGRPLLGYIVDRVRSFGGSRIVLALGHGHEAVRNHVQAEDWHGVEITSVVEPEPRGTGGALADVLPELRFGTSLVLNGDTFARVDPCLLLAFHGETGADASMAASRTEDVSRYGDVAVDSRGRVVSVTEKPSGPQRGGYASCGMYLLERRVVERIPTGRPVSLETEVLPSIQKLYAMKGDFPFIDLGTPESYGRAEEFFREYAT